MSETSPFKRNRLCGGCHPGSRVFSAQGGAARRDWGGLHRRNSAIWSPDDVRRLISFPFLVGRGANE